MAEGNSSFFNHEGPNLNEIISELQAQLAAKNAKADELEAKAAALKNREDQLRMEFRRAEARKTAKASELAAQKGIVKKKEAMYLEHRAKLDRMMEDCRQLELNAEKLKIENKTAIEGATLSLLSISKQEKQNCQFILCGQENTGKMLSQMDKEIESLKSRIGREISEDREMVQNAANALQFDCALAEKEVNSFQKEIELIDEKLKCTRLEFQNQISNDAMDVKKLNENIALKRQTIAKLEYEAKKN